MECALRLNALVFDSITFKRLGMHSENNLEVSFSVRIGVNQADPDNKKVTVTILGDKKEEYSFEIQASGFFSYEGGADDAIIQQNAVAIVMPYIRSEVSILTAQPGVEPVVLPPFNIAEMMKKNNRDK